MPFKPSFHLLVLGCLLLSACTPVALAVETAAPEMATTPEILELEPTLRDVPETTPVETATPLVLPVGTATGTSQPAAGAPPLPVELPLDPADWHHWPILPIVTEKARFIYQYGQSLGNDPHAFSVFGDCQSEPAAFMGVYDVDPTQRAGLPLELQETIAWFKGSFERDGPTIRGGTTAGSLLWSAWHQNRYTCTVYETPLQCELRLHKPSFVIVHVGTHYESRNQDYMRKVLDQLIAAGVVPILATKADDRELDEHVNAQYAQLAVEYDIPFWNFWAAVDSLPNRGLYTRPDATYQGDLYLTDMAVVIHRLTALQALDAVRRAVTRP